MTRLLLTALLALPLLVAGCGGEDESASEQTAAAAASTAAGNGDQQQALQEYQACLQEHGIELPGRPGDGQGPPASQPDGQPPQGTDSAQFQEAQQACGNPPGGMGRGNQTPEQQQALQSCLQEHGVDRSQFGNGNGGPPPAQSGQDGIGSGQGSQPGGQGGPGTQDPAVREALAACQQELGLPGFGGPPPSSTTTG